MLLLYTKNYTQIMELKHDSTNHFATRISYYRTFKIYYECSKYDLSYYLEIRML